MRLSGISSEVCKQQKHSCGRLRGQSASSQEHPGFGPLSRLARGDTSCRGFPTASFIARQRTVSRLSPLLIRNDGHGTGTIAYAAETVMRDGAVSG
jgi:hypothetical protein